MRILVILLVLFCVFCIYNIYVTIFIPRKLNQISNLKDDGYIVKHNILSKKDLDQIKSLWIDGKYKDIYLMLKNNNDIKKFFKNSLDDNYNFMDYIMFLSNSVLHTCHRDNNGSKFNNINPNKSYTLILYIDDMQNCLDIIPKSHKDIGIYSYDATKTFICSPGSIILFDADLFHCGSLETNKNNKRIQMKVCHDDDIEKLSFYNKYYKILDKTNNNSSITKAIQKNLSCSYPIISDYTQGNNKDYISGKLSSIGKIYSKIFYSDKNFYNLKNAFN